MISDSLFIRYVDHRISNALILCFLLWLFCREGKRSRFGLRFSLCCLVMILLSWGCGFLIDFMGMEGVSHGIMEAVRTLLLSVVYLYSCKFCRQISDTEAIYTLLLSFTLQKMAWSSFKAGAEGIALWNEAIPWSRYSPVGSFVSYLVYLSVCTVFFLIYRRLVSEPPGRRERAPLMKTGFLFILLLAFLEFCGRVFVADVRGMFFYYLCELTYTLMNFSILMMMARLFSARHDNADMRSFINNKMQYYQMSHDGIVSLQTKCHDLKHQVALIRSKAGQDTFTRYLDDLENSINGYSTVIDCGNEAVNIVLTEKNILCQSCDVQLSCMADGSIFSFLSDQELYSLFGNALDNALEAASRVTDPDRRRIVLKTAFRAGMAVLHVENDYSGELNVEGGLPHTTKEGTGHGFGLRSIRQIAESHGGTSSIQAADGHFILTVLIPKPDSKA